MPTNGRRDLIRRLKVKDEEHYYVHILLCAVSLFFSFHAFIAGNVVIYFQRP